MVLSFVTYDRCRHSAVGVWVGYIYEIIGCILSPNHIRSCFYYAFTWVVLGALLPSVFVHAQVPSPVNTSPSIEIESFAGFNWILPATSETDLIHANRELPYNNIPLPTDATQVPAPKYNPSVILSPPQLNQENFKARINRNAPLWNITSDNLSSAPIPEAEARPKVCLEFTSWNNDNVNVGKAVVRAGYPFIVRATITEAWDRDIPLSVKIDLNDISKERFQNLISTSLPHRVDIPKGKKESRPFEIHTMWDGRSDKAVWGRLVGVPSSYDDKSKCLDRNIIIYHGFPELSVSPNPVDDGEAVTITVTIQDTSTSDSTVGIIYPQAGRYRYFTDTAHDPDHYQQFLPSCITDSSRITSPSCITIPAGETTGTGTIQTKEFSSKKPLTFYVGIDASGVNDPPDFIIRKSLTVDRTEITIIDNEHPEISFTSANSTAPENQDPPHHVTLTMEPALATPLTVKYILGGDATKDTDYTIENSGEVTVPKDSTSVKIPITILEDNKDELDETVILTLTDGGDKYSLGDIKEHTLTITDNDTSAVSFALETSSVQEGNDTPHHVTLTIDPAPAAVLTVNYTLGGNATEEDDFSIPNSGTVTVPKDSNSAKIPIQIVDDGTMEGDETVILTLTADVGDAYTLGSIKKHTLTISDPDPPEIYFEIDKSSVDEDKTTPHHVTITVDPAPTADLTVNYTLGGNATEEDDFSIPNSGTVTVPKDSSSVRIPISITDDAVDEEDEDILFVLTDGGGTYTIESFNEHRVTIIDNDIPAVGFVESSSSVTEEDATKNVVLSIDPAPAKELTVKYTVDGDATNGTDYTIQNSGEVKVPSGATSVDIPVVIIDDQEDEKNETIRLTLTKEQAYEIKNFRNHEMLIKDNDDSGRTLVDVTLSASPLNVEEGKSVALTVRLSAPLPDDEVITLRDTPGEPPAEPEDYILNLTIMVPGGELEASNTIMINDDDISEGDERFSVALDVLPEGTQRGSSFSVDLTIQDNDDPIPVDASLNVSSNLVDEGESVTVTAKITNPLETDVTIPLIYDNQTQYPPESGDYTQIESITIVREQTEGSETIFTDNDDDLEDEVFIVSLGRLPPKYLAQGTPASQRVTIQDQSPSPLRVDLSARSNDAREGDQIEITATLTAITNEPITIPLTLTNGTANDEDYTALPPRAIEIPVGRSEGTYVISTTDDDIDEGEFETFTVAIDETNLPSELEIENSSVEMKITDDDDAAINAVSFVTVNEGGGQNLEVTLNSQPLSEVKVNISPSLNSVLNISPPELSFTPENWDERQTIQLTAPNNDQVGENEPIILTLTAVGYTLEPRLITVTILDNDTPGIDVQPSLTLQEEETESLMVALLKEPTSSVTITISGFTENLTANKTTLEFSPGSWNQPQTVELTARLLNEGGKSKTVNLTLTASGGGYDGTNQSVSVTIVDRPSVADPTITIFSNEASETQGEIQLRVKLEPPTQETVTVNYKTSDVTATAGEDYVASRGIMIFDAGATSGAIQIMLHPDDDSENEESFQVTLSNPRNARIENGVATATILDRQASASLTISDAWVLDSEAFAHFVVTVSEPQSMPVSVHYHTQDETAVAGEDYEEQQGMITLAPGNMEAVIAVPLLKTGANWQQESFSVHLTSSEDVQITKAVGMATIHDSAAANMQVLTAYATRFVRSASVQVVEALAQRFRSAGDQSSCGVKERADAVRLYGGNSSWAPSLGELLSGCHLSRSTFTYNGQFGVWGRGAFQQFDGRTDDALTLRGQVTTGMLGVDYRWKNQERAGSWLVGMLVSQSRGGGSFGKDSQSGDLTANLTRVYPYISYFGKEWLVWLSGGYGWGDVKKEDLKRDLTSRFGALGLRVHLTSINAVRFSYHGDLLLTDAKLKSHPIHSNVIRVRVGIEGSFQMWPGMQPYMEANVRQDGGDAEIGIGLELGAGVRMNYPSWRLKADLHSQGLVLSTADGFTEWGFSGSVQFGSRSEGFMVLLRPSWGPAQTMSLYHQRTILDLTPSAGEIYRTDLELGYGVPYKSSVARSVVGFTQLPHGRLLRIGGELSPRNQTRFSISALGYHQHLTLESIGVNVQGSLTF